MGVRVREKVKGSGEWWVFINHKGKRRSKKIGDKKTATQVAREVRERLAKGDMGMLKDKCPTVAEYGEKWLQSPFHNWRSSTRDLYSGAFKEHIEPPLGSKRLDEIRRIEIKQLIAELKTRGLSPYRMQTVTGVFRGIFNSAIEDEILDANPCTRTGKFTGRGRKKNINPLTVDEALC